MKIIDVPSSRFRQADPIAKSPLDQARENCARLAPRSLAPVFGLPRDQKGVDRRAPLRFAAAIADFRYDTPEKAHDALSTLPGVGKITVRGEWTNGAFVWEIGAKHSSPDAITHCETGVDLHTCVERVLTEYRAVPDGVTAAHKPLAVYRGNELENHRIDVQR